MTRKQRYEYVIDFFLEHAPNAETELIYDNPFQLLVAVILSAQCTDIRVNLTTAAIFEKFPDAETMSHATFEEIFALIKSISYPNNKSKHLIGMAQMLVADFGGKVPMTVEELVNLPGVIHTPHLAASTDEAQVAVAIEAAELVVVALLKGIQECAKIETICQPLLQTFRSPTAPHPSAYQAEGR